MKIEDILSAARKEKVVFGLLYRRQKLIDTVCEVNGRALNDTDTEVVKDLIEMGVLEKTGSTHMNMGNEHTHEFSYGLRERLLESVDMGVSEKEGIIAGLIAAIRKDGLDTQQKV